ncbi:regulatory protein RecX [Arthrobacter sp. CAN_C5]|uniref:regulatory protein RecX n=1 Tax=Arthrobacter sp. CAN_C5 TaxID=2760706 RepID=UPI001AE4814E|nr:regulatory protein RecX [Arthrobacter sp. CAN_C5]MBP2217524.1 regulatory protein [Arthrobacter sp. CAN_C5]
MARSIVLRQLTLAPKSRHQLASKLAEREVPDKVAAAVLDRFEEVELIDDAEFAMMWVRSRAATRSLARSALKRELAGKGIHGDLAEDALAQVSDDEEREAAEQLVRRKYRPLASAGDRASRDKETRRLVSMLARKGYSPSLAFGVVKAVLDDVAEREDEYENEGFDAVASDSSELDFR